MKKILIALIAITLFGCTKETQVTKISVEQLKVKTGIDLIGAWEIQFGSARVTPNHKKPDKNDIVTLVNEPLPFDGATFTTSDNPKFAGVNNQTTFVSICNWYFNEGSPAQTLTCNITDQHGNIMAWNTNWQDSVFRSNVITIP